MKGILALTIVFSATLGFAQSPAPAAQKPAPIQFKIRHADPWFVKAMLEGIAVSQPELSSRPGFTGLGQAATRGLTTLLKSGKLVVNPTDNSLWWFPD